MPPSRSLSFSLTHIHKFTCRHMYTHTHTHARAMSRELWLQGSILFWGRKEKCSVVDVTVVSQPFSPLHRWCLFSCCACSLTCLLSLRCIYGNISILKGFWQLTKPWSIKLYTGSWPIVVKRTYINPISKYLRKEESQHRAADFKAASIYYFNCWWILIIFEYTYMSEDIQNKIIISRLEIDFY